MIGLLGRKIGMTQLFSEKGDVIPTTVIEAGPCYVVQCKTVKKDGYNAIQIGFEKKSRANKPETNHFKKASLPPLKELKEIRVEDPEKYKPGQELRVDIFRENDKVDITGTSKGRGFAGGVKRWGWKSGPASHGSMSHRRIGSVGATTSPGRVLKGKHLPGHYGMEKVTVKNLKVVKIDRENGLLFVKGAVPGAKGGLLLIRKR